MPLGTIYTKRAEVLFLMWDSSLFSKGHAVKVASCEPYVNYSLVSHTAWLKQPSLVGVHTDSSALWRFCTGYRTWWEGSCRCSPRWGWECTRCSRSIALALPPVITESRKTVVNCQCHWTALYREMFLYYEDPCEVSREANLKTPLVTGNHLVQPLTVIRRFTHIVHEKNITKLDPGCLCIFLCNAVQLFELLSSISFNLSVWSLCLCYK